MTNEWDEYASDWDGDESARLYADQAYNELIKVTSLRGLRVLDFGCGTGLLSERMSKDAKKIVALDGSSKMIDVLNQKNLSNVVTIADFLSDDLMRNHQHLSEPFDLIVASSVCSFLPDYEQTLGVLSHLLGQNSIFVQWDWLSHDEEAGFGLTKEKVRLAHEKVGFVNTQITEPFALKSNKGEMPVLMATSQKLKA